MVRRRGTGGSPLTCHILHPVSCLPLVPLPCLGLGNSWHILGVFPLKPTYTVWHG